YATLQLISAPGAVSPAGLDRAVTRVAGGLHARSAARAKCVTGLYARATARTVNHQRLAQNEVKNNPDPVEKKNSEQGPHDVPHAAAARIPVNIADQQGIARQEQRHDDGGDDANRHGRVILTDKNDIAN